jgi:hypothetical protein
MSSTTAGSSSRSKEVRVHLVYSFLFESCDGNFLLSLSAAIDLDGMVGDGAEQVDASVNTVGIHHIDPCDL